MQALFPGCRLTADATIGQGRCDHGITDLVFTDPPAGTTLQAWRRPRSAQASRVSASTRPMSLVPSATAALVYELPLAISRAGTGTPTRTVMRVKEGHLPSGGRAFLVVGRIWQERRVRPLRSAIETAAPSARHAISVAAITLALSFSMLAIVSLGAFRELAFLLAVGVLIDSFVVRSLLVPALVALLGRTHVETGQAQAGLEAEAVPGGPDRNIEEGREQHA